MLTQWFDPEPTFKGLVFARELVKLGFEVEVITGFPNYPGGKLYPGYKVKLLQREVIDGVHITRLPLYPSHDKGAAGRVLNYVSFAFSALVYGLLAAKKADVIYAYHPPLTVGIAAVLIRFFRRIPVVYDIQDMWPDTLRATGMFSNPRALRLVGKVCDWVYRHVDQLVVLSPGFKRLLVDRQVPEAKVELIYNWCAEESLASPTKRRPDGFPSADKFIVLFAGNMGQAQSLTSVLEAAELLQLPAPQIEFVFLGGGIDLPNLKSIAQSRKLTNVRFLPAVPMSEVGSYLKAADVLLVHLRKDHLFQITIPSKTQAYMAAGKPILMAVDGDAADLIMQSKGGVVAESEDARAIVNSTLKLLSLSDEERLVLGENGRRFYIDQLSLKNGVAKFGRVFTKASKAQRQEG